MRRLSLSLLLVVIIAIVSAGWAVDTLFARLGHSEQSNVQVAEQLGYRLVQLIEAGQLSADESPVIDDASAYQISFPSAESISVPDELQDQLDFGQALMLETQGSVSLYFSLPDSEQVLRLIVPSLDDSTTRLRLILTVLFYSAIAGLVLVWLYPLVRRLQRLGYAVKQFGDGNLRHRIATQPGSQLHAIESEFNAMAQRISSLVDDNKMLSNAVSHDLRTPLARLRFGVDALEEQVSDPLQREYLERISHDLTRMEQLVDVLLEFARLDQRLKDMPLIATELLPLVQQSIDQSRESSDRSLMFDTSYCVTGNGLSAHEDFRIMGDERYLRMLINNVLQNAVKFSESVVAVCLSRDASHIWFHVEDDGPGFPDDDAQHLLKPFEKLDVVEHKSGTVDSRRQKGYGLGLAIVERIAQWNGAQIHLGRSAKLGGAKVSIGFRPV